MRPDGRSPAQLRLVTFEIDYTDYAEGSVLIAMGRTRVLCNASLEPKVPLWLVGKGRGWLTGEYSLLPRSTHTRTPPETLVTSVAAVSVGIVEGEPRLDLCYAVDSTAAVDCNVALTAQGRFVEMQGTAERDPFDRASFDALLALAERGIRQLLDAQQAALNLPAGSKLAARSLDHP